MAEKRSTTLVRASVARVIWQACCGGMKRHLGLPTPVRFAEQLAQGIERSKLVILPGGHANPVEFAEVVATTMLDFLKQQSKD